MQLRIILAAILLGAGCAPLPPAAPPGDAPSLPALQKRITFDKFGTLPELIGHLRSLTGANLVLDPRVASNFSSVEGKRTITLRDIRGDHALRWILTLAAPGIDVFTRDGVAFIDERRRLYPTVHRLHDLAGIRWLPMDRDGGTLALAPPGTIGLVLTTTEIPEATVQNESFIDLIKENIRPGTWEGTQTIERMDNRLLINAPADVHDEVDWFLDTLRSLTPATISVSADLLDADAATLPLLASGSPAVLSAADADAVARRVRAANSARFDLSALDSCRVSTQQSRSTGGLTSYQPNGEPLIGSWTSDVSILDVRPTLVAQGRDILVELRLSLGRSHNLDPVKTPAGPLPRQERTVTRLETTLLVPNGGAVLFSLPATNSFDSRPQLCLLRAVSDDPRAKVDRKPIRLSPKPPQRELFDRLEEAPAVDADFDNTQLHRVVDWLRKTTGLNWLLEPGLQGENVTLHCSGVPVARLLPFLLKPLNLDFSARDDAFYIGSRSAIYAANELCVVDLRDVMVEPADFPTPERERRQSYTGEDIANLIKNTIHKDRWEEADGRSIQYVDGLLFLRNSPDVIRDCLAFVTGEKTRRHRGVAFRADLLTLPAAALPDADGFLDAARVDALVAAAGPSRERLTWQAQEGQRSSLCWDRALDYLADLDGKGVKADTFPTKSHLEIVATSEQNGSAVALALRVRDQRVTEVLDAPLGLQLPVLEAHDVGTPLTLPAGKTAVFRWGGPNKTVRVLLLQAVLQK